MVTILTLIEKQKFKSYMLKEIKTRNCSKCGRKGRKDEIHKTLLERQKKERK